MDAVANFGPWLDDLLNGILTTVLVTVLGAAGALAVAVALGLLARTDSRPPRFVARVIIEFFRGTSLLVQLWWLFFALPALGWQLEPMPCAILAFSLNFGAYGAEVVRGAINAVPRALWEATVALNMTPYQTMRRVIAPQAVVGMIPPFGNLLIQLLKSTPLIYTITIIDVTSVTQSYRASEGNEVFIFSLSMIVYFVLAYLLTLGMNLLERRAKAAIGQREQRLRLFRLRTPVVESELV
jgi:polar amino acid transport system permease protein